MSVFNKSTFYELKYFYRGTFVYIPPPIPDSVTYSLSGAGPWTITG